MESDTSQLKWLYRGLIGFGAFVLVYALSFGPANSFGVRGKIPSATVLAVYRPIPGRVQVFLLEAWSRFDPKVALALNGER